MHGNTKLKLIGQVYDIHSCDMKDTARKQNFLIYREAMTIETPTTTHNNGNSHCILCDGIFLHVHIADRICATAGIHRHKAFTFSHFTLWGGKSVL